MSPYQYKPLVDILNQEVPRPAWAWTPPDQTPTKSSPAVEPVPESDPELESEEKDLGFVRDLTDDNFLESIDWDMLRILILLPGQWSDPIKCELHHAYICKDRDPVEPQYENPEGEHPMYEALSYTWGDPSVQKTIELCGTPFDVGANLESALRHLRTEEHPRRLWIDAICIDQHNLEERSIQVLKMTHIYRQASRVLVWLGEESDNSNMAMDLLERLGGREAEMERREMFENVQIGQYMLTPKDPQSLMNPKDLQDGDWQALASLIRDRDWWSRMWTVQEITHAQEGRIICGSRQITWDTVQSILMRNPYWGDFDPLRASGARDIFHSAFALNAQRRDTLFPLAGYKRAKTRLRTLLAQYDGRRCSDPRDMIYALLGLSSLPQSSLRVDYTKSIRQVYLEAAKVIIQDVVNSGGNSRKSLELLCSAYRTGKEPQYGLPTWVPDWTKAPVFQGFGFGLQYKSPFNASGRTTLVEMPDFTDEGTLIAKGYVWDEIQDVSDFDALYSDFSNIDHFTKCVQQWAPADLEARSYPTGESALDAFWRTLITNRVNVSDQIAPEETNKFRQQFLAWSGREITEIPTSSEVSDEFTENNARSPFDELQIRVYGWIFCTTVKGYFALVPAFSKPGDKIAIIGSVTVPLVLHMTGGMQASGKYELMGPCYVDGIMNGEAVKTMKENKTQAQTLQIV